MCGIIGFTGNEPAKDIIIGGLERLEYRGYDSAGLALLSNDQIQVRKRTGKVEELRKLCEAEKMPATCGIGHTRWATHGGVTDVNAHPPCRKGRTDSQWYHRELPSDCDRVRTG